MKLLIIESPNKVNKLKGFLGPGWTVMATKGHVIDLPEKRLGVDVDDGFAPEYVVAKDKQKTIDAIVDAASRADEVFIATDPDREGEAIGFHIYAKLKRADRKKVKRVKFHSITKGEVQKAVKTPGELDESMFNAQQARRVIDRLVGYQVSPVMAFSGGLRGTSAGRVQSVALKYIADREKEIRAFKPEEYWEIDAALDAGGVGFAAKFTGKLKNQAEAQRVLDGVQGKKWVISSVEEKDTTSNPSAPFTTSSLQQAASGRFGWSGKKTMDVAQKVFEKGACTYIRSDSVTASAEFIEHARAFAGRLGEGYIPEKPIVYGSKSKNAQEAHECIRPTFEHEDEVSGDESRLLDLIRRRFIASQMTPARYRTVTATITAGGHEFVAKGRRMLFDGYQRIWGSESNDVILPELKKGDEVALHTITPEQKFTQPPPKYSDASIVKQLEKDGVGRPSTYASIVDTLVRRKYIEKDGKAYRATDLGIRVSDYLSEHFPDVVNPQSTANMEAELDRIVEGADWTDIMSKWYEPFKESLKAAKKAKAPVEKVDGQCPACEAGLVKRFGRFGPFLSCETYPKCKTIVNIDAEGNVVEKAKPIITDHECEKCGKPMAKRQGKFGPFLGCTGYPKCRNLKNIPVGTCPECGGEVMERYSKKKKSKFFGCGSYPDCEFTANSADEFSSEVPDPKAKKKKAPAKKKATAKKPAKKATRKKS